MLKYLPNLLTILRFFLVPFICYFAFIENYIISIIFLILSGLTDILDGFIARKFDLISDFGKLIDPLADKATQISALIILSIKSIIPKWMLVIVLIKEFALVIGSIFLYEKNLVVSSKWYGKLATVLFYAAIFVSMAIRQFHLNYSFDIYIYYLALFFTLFSLIMYSIEYLSKSPIGNKSK